MAIRPRLYVASPRYTPFPYGLSSVVQWVDETDVHWRNGVQFEPDSFADAHLTMEKCFDTDDDEDDVAAKTATDQIDLRCANPFTVYAELNCPPIGHWDDYKARTIAALDNGQGRPMETAFWTGVTGEATLYPHLASDDVVVEEACVQTAATVVTGSGTAASWQQGIALLEAALVDCYGGVGVIHMPFWVAAILQGEMFLVVDEKRQQLRTRLGTLVAAGTGYPGTGPDGSAPANGAAWIYGTGAIVGRQSAVDISTREEALDRSINRMVMIAERTFVLAWDSCHVCAQINLFKEVP